jgi:predicted phosphate transport protein (TIGR00153 family)
LRVVVRVGVWRMMRWFQALMPREDKFVEMFTHHSEVVVAGARALRSLLEGGEGIPRYCKAVVTHENEADLITRDVLLALRRSFITPFDRTDIKDLITSMDDTIDQMQKTAKSITLFGVHEFEPDMRLMADAILQCAEIVHEAVPLLADIGSKAGRLGGLCERITKIEGRADDMHDAGLKKLYERCAPSNPMAFVIGQEIFDHLEAVVDRFDDVANEIQSIVIEQV